MSDRLPPSHEDHGARNAPFSDGTVDSLVDPPQPGLIKPQRNRWHLGQRPAGIAGAYAVRSDEKGQQHAQNLGALDAKTHVHEKNFRSKWQFPRLSAPAAPARESAASRSNITIKTTLRSLLLSRQVSPLRDARGPSLSGRVGRAECEAHR